MAEGFVWNLAEGLPTINQDGTTKYVTGPGGLPLEQVSSGGTVLYYYQDQLGSTRGLLDASGTTAATYTYDAYGNLKSSTGSVSNPFQYAGQYTDSESGLQYLQARYYDPSTQQFLTVDPISEVTGEPYAYGAGSPVNLIDPTGQWTILDDLTAITVGAAGGAGHSVVTQLATTGSVDWGQVGIDAVAGATGAEVALYAGPVAGGMAAELVSDFGAQVNQNGGLGSIDPIQLASSAVIGGLLGVGAREANSSVGIEMRGGHLRVGSRSNARCMAEPSLISFVFGCSIAPDRIIRNEGETLFVSLTIPVQDGPRASP